MMQSVKKVFYQKDIKFQVFSFLGPLFLMLSLFLATFSKNIHFEYWIISIIGIFICIRYKMIGLLSSVLVLSFFAIIKHISISEQHVWLLGLEFSIVMGFVITFVSNNYISEKLKILKNNKKTLVKNLEELEVEVENKNQKLTTSTFYLNQQIDNLKIELNENEENSKFFQELATSLKEKENIKNEEKEEILKNFAKNEIFLKSLKAKLEESENVIQTLKNSKKLIDEKKQIKQELFLVRKEKQLILEKFSKIETEKEILSSDTKAATDLQKSQIDEKNNQIDELNQRIKNFEKNILDNLQKQESLKNQISQKTEDLEKLKTLSQKKSENVIPVTENNQKMLRRARQFESLYKQLKKQFDDKKDVLHKTRQELFLTNEKLQAYLRKNQMAEFDISPIEKKYIFGLFELENEIKKLEKENNSLEDVISNILS